MVEPTEHLTAALAGFFFMVLTASRLFLSASIKFDPGWGLESRSDNLLADDG